MRVCGIIAEYDPFHLGHLHQLSEARRLSQADYVVCVISCAFTQRGLPALFSTQDRARMALLAGADLVLGMPVSYGCAQANRFALGGVGVLHGLRVVTHLSFGVEASALPELGRLSRLLEGADAGFQGRQRAALRAGHSLARARGEALDCPAQAQALRRPNFVLALCYLSALRRLDSAMAPLPIPRLSDHHARRIEALPSASAIRAAILGGDAAAALAALPEAVRPLAASLIEEGPLHRPEALDAALIARLLTAKDQGAIAELSEGLDRLILGKAREATGRESLVGLVKSRRYPWTRIQRALSGMLLNLEKRPPAPPGYARLLGFREGARPLLGAIARGGFPLVARPARAAEPEVAADLHAEMLWRLGAGQPPAAAYQQKVIKI